jgi:hypothetical protein
VDHARRLLASEGRLRLWPCWRTVHGRPELNALDYTFGSGGVLLRLRGQLRAGWNDRGPRGPFFRGVCTFDWKGVDCRAEVSLYPAHGDEEDTLRMLECREWRYREERSSISWLLMEGVLSVEVPLYVGAEAQASLNPSIEWQGPGRATLRHSRGGGTGKFGGLSWRADLAVFMTFDQRSSKPVEWEKGSGMASAGLPTLGKRR